MRMVGAALALALFGAACGQSDSGDALEPAQGDQASEGMTSSGDSAMEPSVETGAATLTRDLTSLLDSHVFLAGIAVEQAVLTESSTSPQFKAAAGALDSNSKDLAGAIGSVYGEEAEAQFLKLWRAHIGMFVDYTVGGITGDAPMQKKAVKELDRYRKDFGAFIEEATGGELKSADTEAALQMHVTSLVAAVDAMIAGDADVFDKLYAAAHEHMPMTASALAGAIVAQMPDEFDGAVDDPASQLQQGLTDLLDSHVFLAGIAVEQGVLQGLDSPQFQAAAGTLDTNSVDLSKAVASVYGDEAGKQFLKLWRAHIGMFVEYTTGAATGDEKMQQKAQKELDRYRKDFGAFIEKATGGELKSADTEAALQMHVSSLIAAIDAVVAGDGGAFDLLYEAANGHMPETATALSGAIVRQSPEEFSN